MAEHYVRQVGSVFDPGGARYEIVPNPGDTPEQIAELQADWDQGFAKACRALRDMQLRSIWEGFGE